ncbi:hypothetical protein C8R44DRAFT_889787 [Mycena epipterygia]|nr:hypothetical protein C8R44DRAFT_889787 [Mycena epipterygia]
MYITLVFKYDAIQPTDDFQRDASHPIWHKCHPTIRLVGHLSPAVILVLPLVYLSVDSVPRTLTHIERARRDQNELPRQIRRKQHGEHQSISQSLPPSSNPNLAADDGTASIASSSVPTFVPMVVKPSLYALQRTEESDDTADSISSWKDEDSRATTSLEGTSGCETPEEVELDVQALADDDEDATYRISYRENANATPPSLFSFSSPAYSNILQPGVSHMAEIPIQAPQISQLLWFQVVFILGLCFESLSTIIDVASHRKTPTLFATHQIRGCLLHGDQRSRLVVPTLI